MSCNQYLCIMSLMQHMGDILDSVYFLKILTMSYFVMPLDIVILMDSTNYHCVHVNGTSKSSFSTSNTINSHQSWQLGGQVRFCYMFVSHDMLGTVPNLLFFLQGQSQHSGGALDCRSKSQQSILHLRHDPYRISVHQHKLSPAQYSITVQNRGLKHRPYLFAFLHCWIYSIYEREYVLSFEILNHEETWISAQCLFRTSVRAGIYLMTLLYHNSVQ